MTPNSMFTPGRAQALLEKWMPVVNYSSNKVAPIEDERTAFVTSMLLENQEQSLIQEAQNNVSGVFGANSVANSIRSSSDWYATGDNRLPKVLIPMIRRTFPELMANELVGVQPMAGPVGLAFALRYAYEGDALASNSYDGSLVANPATTGSRLAADGQEVGYNYLNTAFTGTSSAALSGNSDVTVLDEDTGIAQVLQNFELTANIPQLVVQFQKTAVEAGTRRLATKWSVELEQDVKNMNGIDIDNEMINAMSYELQAEIDRELVITMWQVCADNAANGSVTIWNAASADARWLGERNRDFYSKVIVEANRIAVRTRRGPANFIIATPKVCAMLEMLQEFTIMPVKTGVNTSGIGIAKVGTVGGRFTVYRDTRTDAQFLAGRRAEFNYALLGYKGAEYYDTGIVFCPYIPVMVQRTLGPNDFSPRVGLMTRYGIIKHIFGAGLYYTLIVVTNLGQAFVPYTQSVYM